MTKSNNRSSSSMLATQWADGMPDREAQVASVNASCQTACQTLLANLKFNSHLLTLDSLAKMEELRQAIKTELHKRAYGVK